MKNRPFTFIVALAAALTLSLLAIAAAAEEEDDNPETAAEATLQHDEAQRALKSGLVKPLDDILAEVRKTFPGDIIEIEFEKDAGRYIYEIELIRPDGRMVELKIDAKTAAVIEVGDD